MKIKELIKGSSIGNLHCFIAKVTDKTTKTGKPYIQVLLKDETGEAPVNVWDTTSDQWNYKINDTLIVTGTVDEFNGNIKLNISSWSLSDRSINSFFRSSERDIEGMFAELSTKHLKTFKDPLIVYLCERLIVAPSLNQMFITAPAAAGMHHPWIGGLLEHVLGLCNLADSVYENHYKIYFPELKLEYIKFGLIFHDWGKVLEYDYNSPNIRYTERGVLQHHMGIVAEAITRKAVEFEASVKDGRAHTQKVLPDLLHIIYSHHGQLEWGSIMKPATPEALFVHWLDNFDAQIMHMRETIQKGAGDMEGFSQKSWSHGTAYRMQDVSVPEAYR